MTRRLAITLAVFALALPAVADWNWWADAMRGAAQRTPNGDVALPAVTASNALCAWYRFAATPAAMYQDATGNGWQLFSQLTTTRVFSVTGAEFTNRNYLTTYYSPGKKSDFTPANGTTAAKFRIANNAASRGVVNIDKDSANNFIALNAVLGGVCNTRAYQGAGGTMQWSMNGDALATNVWYYLAVSWQTNLATFVLSSNGAPCTVMGTDTGCAINYGTNYFVTVGAETLATYLFYGDIAAVRWYTQTVDAATVITNMIARGD